MSVTYADNTDSGVNRAQAEGVVLHELEKVYHPKYVLVVYLPTEEVEKIAKNTPNLSHKIISKAEYDAKYKHSDQAPETCSVTLETVELSNSSALILGGVPFYSLSGWQDKFYLKKVQGKWTIVKREKYLVA